MSNGNVHELFDALGLLRQISRFISVRRSLPEGPNRLGMYRSHSVPTTTGISPAQLLPRL